VVEVPIENSDVVECAHASVSVTSHQLRLSTAWSLQGFI